jgi:hypothetical protein
MKKRSLLFVITGIIIWAAGCKRTDEKFISEGEIEYEASVLDLNNSMATMAPNKMTVRFKANKSCAEMTAGMGLFSTSFISDPETKTFTQLVKILNKKFMLIQNEASINKENDRYPIQLIPTSETKLIAGYKCMKMKVIPLDRKSMPFDIFYTKELNIQHPNFTNPFYKVDGVLMEYQLKKFGLEMRFIAKAVKPETIDDKCFQVPSDYKKVSEKEMKMIFEDLQ